MIARHWRGWTTLENAQAYEDFLRQRIFPALRGIEGHRGVCLLRRDHGEQAEFVVVNLFDSLQAVKRFAGEQYAAAVIEPEAKRLLQRWDERAEHYEVRAKIGVKEEADS
jgi:heme-degrading monooxygenase HmoA